MCSLLPHSKTQVYLPINIRWEAGTRISDCTEPLRLHHLSYCTETSSAHISGGIKTRIWSWQSGKYFCPASDDAVLLGCCFPSPANSSSASTSAKSEGAAHVLLTASTSSRPGPPRNCQSGPYTLPFNRCSFEKTLFNMSKCLPKSTAKPESPSVTKEPHGWTFCKQPGLQPLQEEFTSLSTSCLPQGKHLGSLFSQPKERCS